MIHGIFHGDLHGGNLFVLPDGRTALLDFGIVGRLSEPRRLAFLRLLLARDRQRRARPARGAARPRCPAARHRPRRRDPRPRPRRAGRRPDHAERRRAGQRDPADRQGAARLRRPAAQGAHALRQEHGVPRRCHRHARPRPRHPRRDRQHLDVLRRRPTASASAEELGIDPGGYELDLDGRAGQLRRRAGHRGRGHLPRAPGSRRGDHPRAGCSKRAQREARRRPLLGRLRGPPLRPPADGHPPHHGEGRRLRRDPRRRRRLQAAQLDERAEPPGRGATASWTVTNPKGERLDDHDRRGALRHRPRPRRRPRPAEGRRRGPPAGAAGRGLPPASRRAWCSCAASTATEIGPVDLLCRDAEGRAVAIEIKRRGEIDGVEQLARYLECLERDPTLRPVRGMFVAQVIKPQAKVLAPSGASPASRSTTTPSAGVERAQTSLF